VAKKKRAAKKKAAKKTSKKKKGAKKKGAKKKAGRKKAKKKTKKAGWFGDLAFSVNRETPWGDVTPCELTRKSRLGPLPGGSNFLRSRLTFELPPARGFAGEAIEVTPRKKTPGRARGWWLNSPCLAAPTP